MTTISIDQTVHLPETHFTNLIEAVYALTGAHLKQQYDTTATSPLMIRETSYDELSPEAKQLRNETANLGADDFISYKKK